MPLAIVKLSPIPKISEPTDRAYLVGSSSGLITIVVDDLGQVYHTAETDGASYAIRQKRQRRLVLKWWDVGLSVSTLTWRRPR